MPYDLSRWHHRATKNYEINKEVSGYFPICHHLKKNPETEAYCEAICNDNNTDFYADIEDFTDIKNNINLRQKQRYNIFVVKSCSSCSKDYYGRKIKYDWPSGCTSYFLGGNDGCEPCCSRFSHNSNIRPIASKLKWRGIYTKRRNLPQRMNKDVAFSKSLKSKQSINLKKKKCYIKDDIKFEITECVKKRNFLDEK